MSATVSETSGGATADQTTSSEHDKGREGDLPAFRMPAPVPKPAEPKFNWPAFILGGANALEVWPQEFYVQDYAEGMMPRTKMHYVLAPDAVAQIMKLPEAQVKKSTLQDNALEPVLGNGLLNATGIDWKQQRRILAPVFAPRNLVHLKDEMKAAALRSVARLKRPGARRPFDLQAEMSHLTLDFIAEGLFGGLSTDDMNALSRATDGALHRIPFVGVSFFLIPSRRITDRLAEWNTRKLRGLLRRLTDEFSTSYAADPAAHSGNLLGLLMKASEAEDADLGDDFLLDQTATFLLAGHETTAKALAWTIYCLASDPARMARLRADIDAHGPESAYLNAVIQEGMRIYPPAVMVPRQAASAFELQIGDQQVQFAEGDMILMSPWLLHRHEKYWDQPDKFIPERWLEPGFKPKGYFPFGLGPRVCIGQALAMDELRIMLAELVQNLDFGPVADRVPQPRAALTITSRTGVMVTAESR